MMIQSIMAFVKLSYDLCQVVFSIKSCIAFVFFCFSSDRVCDPVTLLPDCRNLCTRMSFGEVCIFRADVKCCVGMSRREFVDLHS